MLSKLGVLLKKQLATPQDKVLAVMGLAFVVIFSFWTYQQTVLVKETNEPRKAFDTIPDTSSTSTQRDGIITNDGATQQTSQSTAAGVWVATDYDQGDIGAGSYSVKSGDTLWEIAEAVYGDGTMWTSVLAANASQIGFLPDGSQALIFPGQVLQLPSLM